MNTITNMNALMVNLITIVLLPLLVMQARYLLYRFRGEHIDTRKDLLAFIEDKFAYDLSIIGVTLGFASIAAIQVIATPPANTQNILISFVMGLLSFFIMAVIEFAEKGKNRLLLGFSGYMIGVFIFLLAQRA